jgi:hypothetical protein
MISFKIFRMSALPLWVKININYFRNSCNILKGTDFFYCPNIYIAGEETPGAVFNEYMYEPVEPEIEDSSE